MVVLCNANVIIDYDRRYGIWQQQFGVKVTGLNIQQHINPFSSHTRNGNVLDKIFSLPPGCASRNIEMSTTYPSTTANSAFPFSTLPAGPISGRGLKSGYTYVCCLRVDISIMVIGDASDTKRYDRRRSAWLSNAPLHMKTNNDSVEKFTLETQSWTQT